MAITRPTVRTLDQIMSELGTVYDPQVQTVQSQIADLPRQIQAEEAGLQAKQGEAFGSILSGARQRGTGIAFGGIPLAEQAQYTASTYMPALAQLKTAGKQQATSLQSAINEIRERQQANALTQQQYEQQRADAFDSEQRQLAASQASSSNLQNYLASLQTPATTATPTATATRKAAGDYAFYDINNKPITAFQYSQQTGQDLGDVLYEMGNDGDMNAKIIYNALADRPNDPYMINMLRIQYPWIMGDGTKTPTMPTKTTAPIATTIPKSYASTLYTGGL